MLTANRWLALIALLGLALAAENSHAQPNGPSQPSSVAGVEAPSDTNAGDAPLATKDESKEQGLKTEPAKTPPKKPAANPCATAFKPVFYDNDFGYLKDPTYCGHCFGDCWKLMPVDHCDRYGSLDVGGQMRLRYHHEVGMGQDITGPGVRRFEDTVHDIMLSRVRLYTNWKLSESTRVYVEGFSRKSRMTTTLPSPPDASSCP